MIDEKMLFILIRGVAVLWILNGIGHWLIIFGVFPEDKAPDILINLFRIFAVLTLVIGFGMWNMKDWSRALGIFVAILSLLAHGWMVYSQVSTASPVEKWRFLEILQVTLFIIFVNLRPVAAMFH